MSMNRSIYLVALCLAIAMFNLTLVVAGLKEFIIEDLGGTVHDATLFFSIETIAYVLFAPLWGLISDRSGRRRPWIVLGFALSAVLYLLMARVDRIGILFVLRFIQGASSVMGWSLLMAYAVDSVPDERRGRAMGWIGAALIFGVSLGAPMGGYFTRWMGPRAPLLFAAGLFALIAVLAVLLAEQPHHRRSDRFGGYLRSWSREPKLGVPLLFHFVDRFAVGFFLVVFPLYLAQLGVDDAAVRGRFLAAFLLPFALLQPVAARVVERISPYIPLVSGSLVYGAAFATIGFASLQQLWWVMALLGTLAAVMFPPSIALVGRYSSPDRRGAAMGLFNLAGSLGFAAGPLVGSWALAWRGYAATFMIGGGLEMALALSTAAWVWASKTSRSAST